MKTQVIILLSVISSLVSAQIYDDVYFKPSDKIKTESSEKIQKPLYKNGAKQIIYIQKKELTDRDTTYADILVSDSIGDNLATIDTLYENAETGYYLNGFQGSQSDFEYAERIRKFHDPKYTIFISDPRYNDIYFLNEWDWNVYVDGSYAFVTPTWTNPMWYDYYWRPFSYNSWNWYSPYSYYNNYYYNPYSWNMWGPYYGGYYGSYYGSYYSGWGYPYNNYYNNWGYYPYWGYGGYSGTYKNDNHNDAVRRTKSGGSTYNSDLNNVATRVSGSYNKTATTRSSVNSNNETTRMRTTYSGVSGVNGTSRTSTPALRNSSTQRQSVDLNSRTTRTSSGTTRQSSAVRSSSVKTSSNTDRVYRSSSESTNIVRTPTRTNSSNSSVTTRSYSPSNSSSSSSSSSTSSYRPSTSSSSSSSSGSSTRSSSSSGGSRSSSGSGSRR